MRRTPLASARSPGLEQLALWLREQRAELIAAFALLWIAYGFLGFNLSTAGDDWVALTDDSILIRYALENGRWLHALTMVVQDHSRVAPTFSISVLLLAILVAMALFAHALRLKRPGSVTLFIVLTGCFPFWAEFASFRILHLPGALALLLSCAYGHIVWLTVARHSQLSLMAKSVWVLAAALLFSLCAATYQGFLPIGLMLLACYLLGTLGVADQQRYHKLGISAGLYMLLSFAVGVLFYSSQVVLARSLTGIGGSAEPYYQLASSLVANVDELRMTLSRLASYLSAFYTEPNHLFPLWPKLIFLVILLVFLLRCLFAQSLAPRGKRLWVFAVLGILIVSPWALGLIRVPDPYRYNAIVSAGLVYGVVICFTLDHMRATMGRGLVFTAGVAIALCFVFEQNSASNITHQNNLRDMAVVNRLLDRLTQAEGYTHLSRHAPVKVVLSGEFLLPDRRPFRSTAVDSVLGSSIIDCDILMCQPAKLDWAIPLVSADEVQYNFIRLADQSPHYQAILQPILAQLATWPARDSVKIIDDTTVVVRLTENRAGLAATKPPTSGATVVLAPITTTGDGFVLLDNDVGAFGVALSNFGGAATYRITSGSTIGASVRTAVCQTEPSTGSCIGTPSNDGVKITMAANQSATVAVFATAAEHIDKDVLKNRLIVRVLDDSGHVRAATSVGITSKIP